MATEATEEHGIIMNNFRVLPWLPWLSILLEYERYPLTRCDLFIPYRPADVGTETGRGRWHTPGINVDRVRQAHYIVGMSKKVEYPGIEQELAKLEQQVVSLLEITERLMKENRSLRIQQDSLATERAGLLEKHDQVRNRVDAIVTRLKSLETGI
jgi:cell division protein ZapB